MWNSGPRWPTSVDGRCRSSTPRAVAASCSSMRPCARPSACSTSLTSERRRSAALRPPDSQRASSSTQCLTNDLNRITPGAAQYTLCCDESGGTVDDLIAYLVSDDEVFLVPNASNTAEVIRRLQAAAPDGHRGDRAARAVRGHRGAGPPVERGAVPAGLLPAQDLDYMAYVDSATSTAPDVRVCRTGYTGEHGYELIPAWDDATVAVGRAGRDRPCTRRCPAGLGARDTLRTEMGYPLHGQDLSLRRSRPVQARAGWAVGWKKDAFWGARRCWPRRAAGPARRAVGPARSPSGASRGRT